MASVLAGCTTFMPTVELPPGETQVSVPVHQHKGLLLASVKINGEDVGHFLIDTGADVNVVDDELAARLELSSGPASFSVAAGGRLKVSLSRVGEMRLGTLVLRKHRVVVADLEALSRAAGMKVGGLLGHPLFCRFPVTVDYRASTMTFYHPDHFQPPLGAQPVELTLWKGRPYIKALVNGKDEVWMLVDTAANALANFNETFARAHPELLAGEGGRIVAGAGVGGEIEGVLTELEALDALGISFRKVPVTLFVSARGMKPDREPRGTIGAAILKNFRLTFDYRHKRLWVEWLPPKSAPALPVEATAD